MATKKFNTIIIIASVIISAAVWVITLRNHSPKRIESRVFKVVNGNGWGYDILVNDSILIHQESIPVLQKQQPFVKKEQAEKTAQLVLQKIKSGQHPTLTKFDLEKILGSDEINGNGQKNLE